MSLGKITKFPNFTNLLNIFIIERFRLSVFGFRMLPKAVKEKISTKGQACLKPKVDIFYFNNSQSYPKSASAQKQNDSFAESFW